MLPSPTQPTSGKAQASVREADRRHIDESVWYGMPQPGKPRPQAVTSPAGQRNTWPVRSLKRSRSSGVSMSTR